MLCGGMVVHVTDSVTHGCYKETQWEAGRHKQELEQETMKGTRTGT